MRLVQIETWNLSLQYLIVFVVCCSMLFSWQVGKSVEGLNHITCFIPIRPLQAMAGSITFFCCKNETMKNWKPSWVIHVFNPRWSANSQSPHLASSCIVEFDSISRHCTSEARYACSALGWNELNLLNLHSQDDSDGALNYFAQTRRSTFNLACWFLFKLVTYFILRAF